MKKPISEKEFYKANERAINHIVAKDRLITGGTLPLYKIIFDKFIEEYKDKEPVLYYDFDIHNTAIGEDMSWLTPYSNIPMKLYSRSKLANLVFHHYFITLSRFLKCYSDSVFSALTVGASDSLRELILKGNIFSCHLQGVSNVDKCFISTKDLSLYSLGLNDRVNYVVLNTDISFTMFNCFNNKHYSLVYICSYCDIDTVGNKESGVIASFNDCEIDNLVINSGGFLSRIDLNTCFKNTKVHNVDGLTCCEESKVLMSRFKYMRSKS